MNSQLKFISVDSAVSVFFPGFNNSQSFKHFPLQNIFERDILIFLSRPQIMHLMESSLAPPTPL